MLSKTSNRCSIEFFWKCFITESLTYYKYNDINKSVLKDLQNNLYTVMRIYSSIDFAASVVICSGRLFFWKKFRMKPIKLIDWFIWTTVRSARIPSKIRSEICLISGWLLLLCPLHWTVLFTNSSQFHNTVVKQIFCLLNRSNEYDVWLSVRRFISSFISRYEESNGFLFAVIGWIVTKWPHVEYFNFGTKCINIWNKKKSNLHISFESKFSKFSF